MALLDELIELTIVEAIRSKTFDMSEFRTISKKTNNVNVIYNYALKTKLKELGAGSSRVVFLLGAKKVLKIAMNDKGIAQNETEADVSTSPKTKPIIAKVLDYDDGFKWLISEIVRPINEREFAVIAGMSFNNFVEDIRWFWEEGTESLTKTPKDKMIAATIETMRAHDLIAADIVKKVDHWGKTADGRVVLLDYGYTKNVYAKHYKETPEPTDRSDSDVTTRTHEHRRRETDEGRVTSGVLETLVKLILTERTRSKTFVLSDLKRLVRKSTDPLRTAWDYVHTNKRLKYLGMGSSRAVYLLSSTKVLKLAKNEAGIAQNAKEVDVYTDPRTRDIVAKIYDFDDKYTFIVSELVREYSYSRSMPFEDTTGFGFGELKRAVYTLLHDREISEEASDDMIKLARSVAALIDDHDAPFDEVMYLMHWGKARDGRPVILDYGLTSEIMKAHYGNNKLF